MPPTKAAEDFQTKVKKHQNFKKQKHKLFRAKEPLLSVFMWGINHTINELGHVRIPVMLLPEDFKAYTKTKVDNQYFNKDVMPSHFKVKEYCPLVFRNLRERFEVGDDQYLYSLTKSEPVYSDAKDPKFLESFDRRFIVKFISSDEVATMHSILKYYHQHIVETRGLTLLPQFLGLYRLSYEEKETYVCVMRNIVGHRFRIHKKYDLKGSTVDRSASDKEKTKDLPTFKDNDFLQDGIVVDIGPDSKKAFLEMLQIDINFLASQNLMDYSLLVCIHDTERGEQEIVPPVDLSDSPAESDASGGIASGYTSSPPESPLPAEMLQQEGAEEEKDAYSFPSGSGAVRREIYYMGLIDILTNYGMKKRTANMAKTMKHGADADISTVKPEQYARRLIEFIAKCIR